MGQNLLYAGRKRYEYRSARASGVVGGGVWELAADRQDVNVKRVLLRCPKDGLPAAVTTMDINDILCDDTIDTVVEVMGGLHPAYEYVTAAMERGKHVVTANKALCRRLLPGADGAGRQAGRGPALHRRRRRRHSLAGEPVPREAAGHGLRGGRYHERHDQLHHGRHAQRAPSASLIFSREAQALGYAEADPSADIDGDDIRRKLCISANIAFDAVLDEAAIPTFGIRTVTAADIAAFQAHGFVCKLLATAQASEGGVCAFVEPTLVDKSEPEAAVPANYNLIGYTAERVGKQTFFGQGAGRFPTASNVMQDCLTVLAGERGSTPPRPSPAGAAAAHPLCPHRRAGCVLHSRVADDWGTGVITGAVDVYEMLAWAKRQREIDPACFIAAIR